MHDGRPFREGPCGEGRVGIPVSTGPLVPISRGNSGRVKMHRTEPGRNALLKERKPGKTEGPNERRSVDRAFRKLRVTTRSLVNVPAFFPRRGGQRETGWRRRGRRFGREGTQTTSRPRPRTCGRRQLDTPFVVCRAVSGHCAPFAAAFLLLRGTSSPSGCACCCTGACCPFHAGCACWPGNPNACCCCGPLGENCPGCIGAA